MLARSGPANIFIQLRVQGNYIKKKIFYRENI